MGTIRTNTAAEMLGVSPSTLRSWEKRYEFPVARRTDGGHRTFDLTQLEALATALRQTNDPAAAIEIARHSRDDDLPANRQLAAAFAAFDDSVVDQLLERSLATRSLERTIEQLLLPTIEGLTPDSAEAEFAARYATGWLAAQKRLVGAATREEAVLIVDGSEKFTVDALHAQALELAVRRASCRALVLGAANTQTLRRAAKAVAPTAVVLCGSCPDREAYAKAVYAIRSAASEARVFNYRDALPDTGASTVIRLDMNLTEVHRALFTEPVHKLRSA